MILYHRATRYRLSCFLKRFAQIHFPWMNIHQGKRLLILQRNTDECQKWT